MHCGASLKRQFTSPNGLYGRDTCLYDQGMPFFKTTPNLPDGERARIEFHLQQILECIGSDRCRQPVLSLEELLYDRNEGRNRSVDQLKLLLGSHLNHDVHDIQVQTMPMQLQKVGGGG